MSEAVLNGLGQALYPMFSLDFIAISSVLPRAHLRLSGRRSLIRGPGASPKANPAVYLTSLRLFSFAFLSATSPPAAFPLSYPRVRSFCGLSSSMHS